MRREAFSSAHEARVSAYYHQTWWDFHQFWSPASNPGMHFGYWDSQTKSHTDSLTEMNRRLAERVQWDRCQSVLDAGCGVGGSAVWLAEEYAVRVTGISIIPFQLKLAQRHARQRGVEHLVHFEHSDYVCTGFPDNSFDVIWAQESICHAESKKAFFAEAFRLLRPGGMIVASEYVRVSRAFSPSDANLWRAWLSGWQIPHLPGAAQITHWLSDAGFENVNIDDITPHMRRSSRRLHRLAQDFFPIAVLLREFGMRSNIQHGNVCGARFQWMALQRGLWFYAILSARKHGASH